MEKREPNPHVKIAGHVKVKKKMKVFFKISICIFEKTLLAMYGLILGLLFACLVHV